MARGVRARKRLRRTRRFLIWLIFGLVTVSVLISAGTLPEDYLPIAAEWGVAIGTALIFSLVIGHVLAFLTGDLFERKLRVWRIGVPLFPLITFAVKWWLFGF